MAFPSGEFGSQELATDELIQQFAASKGFPGFLMKLGSVTGNSAPEVWRYMRDQSGESDPGWNFDSKFLVSKTGDRVLSVSSGTQLEAEIKALVEE